MKDVNVPEGYKSTDIGVIPEDWKIEELGNISKVVRGGSPRPAGDPKFFGGYYISWLTVAALTNIPDSYIYVSKVFGYLTEEGAKQSRTLENGTLIIANSGATLGVSKILSIKCCANDGIAALIELNKSVDTVFLCYFLNTKTKEFREVIATGNGQPNLNTTLISLVKTPLPPLPEQKAIARVLGDVDELIRECDSLLAKKRDIKQATMQQLLTGKKRLPGFSGAWREKNLLKTSTLKARIGWQGLTTKEYLDEGEYFLVTGTDFDNGKIKWSTCHFVEKIRYDQDKNIQLKNDDILLTKDGTIGKVAYIDNLPKETTLNSGVFVIRPKNKEYELLYFYNVLMSEIFDSFLRKLKAGSTISHLYQKDFVSFNFLLPPTLPEQKAIAEILSDMDSGIEALEQMRDKYKAIKQGMMQELLTGKTRLVDN